MKQWLYFLAAAGLCIMIYRSAFAATMSEPTVVTTDWNCELHAGDLRCERRIGDSREVRVVQDADADRAFIFIFSDLDETKIAQGKTIIGDSTVIGWPQWFPVFNRRRVYEYQYPVKGWGASVTHSTIAATECIAYRRGEIDTHLSGDKNGVVTIPVSGYYVFRNGKIWRKRSFEAGFKTDPVEELLSQSCGVFYDSIEQKLRAKK